MTFGWDACPGRASQPRHWHLSPSAQHSLKVASPRGNPQKFMLLLLHAPLRGISEGLWPGFLLCYKPEHNCSGSESHKGICVQDAAMSERPGARIVAQGAAARATKGLSGWWLGLSPGVWYQPVPGQQNRCMARLCLCFVPALKCLCWMCRPLFSSARAERELFKAWG